MLVVLAVSDGSIQIMDAKSGSLKKVFNSDLKPNLSVSVSTSEGTAIVSYVRHQKTFYDPIKLSHLLIDLRGFESKKIEGNVPEVYTIKTTNSPDSKFYLVESTNTDKKKLVQIINVDHGAVMSKHLDNCFFAF